MSFKDQLTNDVLLCVLAILSLIQIHVIISFKHYLDYHICLCPSYYLIWVIPSFVIALLSVLLGMWYVCM